MTEYQYALCREHDGRITAGYDTLEKCQDFMNRLYEDGAFHNFTVIRREVVSAWEPVSLDEIAILPNQPYTLD